MKDHHLRMLATGVGIYTLTAFLDAQTLFDALRGMGTGLVCLSLLMNAVDIMED